MNNGETRKKIYKILVGIVFCMLAGVYIFGMVFQLYIKNIMVTGLGAGVNYIRQAGNVCTKMVQESRLIILPV